MCKRGRSPDESGEFAIDSASREIFTYSLIAMLTIAVSSAIVPQKNGSEQIDGLNLQLEFVQTENEILKSELGIAQEQIETLKTSLANVSLVLGFRGEIHSNDPFN